MKVLLSPVWVSLVFCFLFFSTTRSLWPATEAAQGHMRNNLAGKKGQRDACRAVAGLTLTLTLGIATRGDLEASVLTNTSALISVAERPHQLPGCRCSQSLWVNHRKPAESKLSLKFKSFCGTWLKTTKTFHYELCSGNREVESSHDICNFGDPLVTSLSPDKEPIDNVWGPFRINMKDNWINLKEAGYPMLRPTGNCSDWSWAQWICKILDLKSQRSSWIARL